MLINKKASSSLRNEQFKRNLNLINISIKLNPILLLFKYEDYIGLENLSSAFLKLDLPRASDILNAASGPGILSASVRGKKHVSW